MPCCCVTGCHNRAEKGYRLYKLPQGEYNINRRNLWVRNIGRKDTLPQHAYVCQDHFTDDQFESARADHKKLLKWNAVPTIFSHHKTMTPERYVERKIVTNVESNDLLREIESNNVSGEIESNNILREFEPDNILEEIVIGEQIIEIENCENDENLDETVALKRKLKAYQEEIRTLKTIINRLQKFIMRLLDKYWKYEDESNGI